MKASVFLLLGGNLGNVQDTFVQATRYINQQVGAVCQKSRVYRSAAWGFEAEQLFLNQVLQITTHLLPTEVLSEVLLIEQSLGRLRKEQQYTSRTIDIDLLFYDDRVMDTPELVLPHPRLHLRLFTLKPLHDLCPEKIHPVLQQSVAHLLTHCPDKADVQVLNVQD